MGQAESWLGPLPQTSWRESWWTGHTEKGQGDNGGELTGSGLVGTVFTTDVPRK